MKKRKTVVMLIDSSLTSLTLLPECSSTRPSCRKKLPDREKVKVYRVLLQKVNGGKREERRTSVWVGGE